MQEEKKGKVLRDSMGAEETGTEEEAVVSVRGWWAQACRLADRCDPPGEPYVSRYAARALLVQARHALVDREAQRPQLGAVLLRLALLDLDTEETGAAARALAEASDLLAPLAAQPQAVVTLVTVHNHLGVLSSGSGEALEAERQLRAAQNVYRDFKEGGRVPVAVDALFDDSASDPAAGVLALEKAHTLTLYYLAQLRGAAEKNLQSAIYCHLTLRRQLQYEDYDPVDWALNAATLSQFFAEQNGFLQSRHHLAAASFILSKLERELNAEETLDEAHLARMEIFRHRSADIARCWAKYCLMLLNNSKNRLMTDADTLLIVNDLSNLKIENEDIEGSSLTNLFFPNMELTEFENAITANFLLTFTDARKVFLECQTWLNKAKEYYQLNTLASDYIELVQDNSQAYSYLLFFEEDDERQAKMHKRRINMLEELVKEINPTYYLQYCRQLWYELGEVYSDILNIKLDKLKNNPERPTPQTLNKINILSEQSIINFEHFLDSVKDKATGCLPAKLEQDVVRPVVTAYAIIGRNYMKIITPDKKIQLNNFQKSLDAYKAVKEYCDKDTDATNLMPEEVSLCQEMVSILPLKIKKLEAEAIAAGQKI